MEIMTSWMEEGIEKGRAEGRQQATLEVVLRQLSRGLGSLPEAAAERVRSLPLPELEALAEALLGFRRPEDLDRWLSRRP